MQEDNIRALLECESARDNLGDVPDELLERFLEPMPDKPEKFYTALEHNPIRVATGGGVAENGKPWTTINFGALIGNRHATQRSLLETLASLFYWKNDFIDPSNFKALGKELKSNKSYLRMFNDSPYPCSLLGQRTDTDPRHPDGNLRARTAFLLVPHAPEVLLSYPVYEISTGGIIKPNTRIGISKYGQLLDEAQRRSVA